MLAQPQRRQHLSPHHHSTLPSPPSSQHSPLFDTLPQQHFSTQAIYDTKILQNYLESQQQFPIIVDSDLPVDQNPYMTDAYDFANPSIRIQQSTPTPQLQGGFASMMPATSTSLDHWNNFANNGQSLQTPRTGRTHQRASSSSSIGSNGSQFSAVGSSCSYPSIAQPESSPSSSAVKLESSYAADEPSRAFSNHLPTPTHTPTQDSFMANMNNNYNTFISNTSSMNATMPAASLALTHALMDQHVGDDEAPGFAHSARHSVSSYGHDSPATPRTAHGDEYNDRFKMPPHDMRPQHTVPKFERTFTDVAADCSYDLSQSASSSAQAQPAANAALLSPFRAGNDILQRTFKAAENARSHSPSSSTSRGVSPFRKDSPYVQSASGFNSPRPRIGTASEARDQKREADAAYAMKVVASDEDEAEPKTISPRDALLDYDDTESKPLFQEGGPSAYSQYDRGDQYRNATQSNFDTTSGQSYRRDSWVTPQFSPNFTTNAPASSQSSQYSFVAPTIASNLHGLPYASTSQYRAHNNMPAASEQAPEFPAHLTSMESSASEAEPPNSQTSMPESLLPKPAPSAADSGTYTCTYHGCTLRFETPQKLQKHKREGHRNANPSISTTMTSAALLERNSQAGPHKCERINPTTGKPCNTIFSRPYDLTRHEDTIHNIRKQKVRCALCVEEKTFSRNDALTRHMRVVHPEIDFPGKHRRRGANHD